MIEIPSTILLATNHDINDNEHHGYSFIIMKSEGAKFDWAINGQIIIAENIELD